ncbi:MAG: type II secretion system protein [bacterium]
MKKGFTLVELLVVIAIIGVLASIVLVSFPSASKKAKDSRIVSAVTQARKMMLQAFVMDNSYSAFSTTSPSEMTTLGSDVSANSPSNYVLFVTRKTGNTGACMYAVLNAKLPTNYWYCVDSTGKFGYTTTYPASLTGCAGSTPCCTVTNAICPTVIAEP